VTLAVFSSGFLLGRFTDFGGSNRILAAFSSEDKALFNPFTQAWEIVNDRYIDQPVDKEKLVQGSIKGMMESLGDPYSSYLDPDQFRDQNAPLEGEYTGIGAWVDTSGEYLVFISPMPDSPAEEAGIEPGDKVIAIDGEDVTGLDPSLVLNKVLGPADTEVSITILRNDDLDSLTFTITRAVIPIPSVESEILDNDIGYIRLYTFGVNSYSEFSDALKELLENGAAKIIFDLRNNTGGIVDTAIDVSSLFLPKDSLILVEEWGDGTTTEYITDKEPLVLEEPLIVLINQGTASASEITAGALQDLDRAELVGTTTFGKGLIQNWIPLSGGEDGAIRVTIARWLTPNGTQIQDRGLNPDETINYTQEDFDTGIDPQLEMAIEMMQEIN
jgi:carboxyl-terminal processing protease